MKPPLKSAGWHFSPSGFYILGGTKRGISVDNLLLKALDSAPGLADLLSPGFPPFQQPQPQHFV
jgi:hypothetical protein